MSLSFRLNALKYLMVYATPIIVFLSIWVGNHLSYMAIFIFFFFLPAIELFTSGSTKNLSKIEEEVAKKDRLYDFILYGIVPAQYFLVIFFLFQVNSEEFSLSVKLGMMIAMGMSCGIIGINGAHELGHRFTWYEQLMSKMLLLTSLYMHFFIEHNRGHHQRVSTDEDPASSRLNESVYAFWLRSVVFSWLSAWELEAVRLRMKKRPVFSMYNEMIWYQIIQLAVIVAIVFFFGWETALFFIGAAIIGFLLLETVNYIEHYGLRRKKNGDRYERTMPIHSWNSNHPLGRLFLFELSRHSDHHYIASRKYQLLRHHDESPQMPTGYPGMMVLSLIPPLWFKVVNREIERYRSSSQGGHLA
jgi:alkane 1-monooxygenase